MTACVSVGKEVGRKGWPPAQFSVEFGDDVSRKMHGAS